MSKQWEVDMYHIHYKLNSKKQELSGMNSTLLSTHLPSGSYKEIVDLGIFFLLPDTSLNVAILARRSMTKDKTGTFFIS